MRLRRSTEKLQAALRRPAIFLEGLICKGETRPFDTHHYAEV
jgi:hypothetical protein